MTGQEKIREMLRNIIPILNINKVRYWVDCGTLLGIIREGDIIKWDHDGDISYFYSLDQWKKLITCLKFACDQYGYYSKVIYKGRPRLYYSDNLLSAAGIDFYAWIDGSGNRYTSTEPGFLKDLWPYKAHIGEPKLHTWDNMLVYVPQDAEARLKQLYKDWKMPKNKVPYWG